MCGAQGDRAKRARGCGGSEPHRRCPSGYGGEEQYRDDLHGGDGSDESWQRPLVERAGGDTPEQRSHALHAGEDPVGGGPAVPRDEVGDRVELNREIVPRQRYAEIVLKAGDEVEIVQMMAGG